ncbi:MAG TPA: hypothetical protein VL358_00470 [Caulobacteraceae bacterium]|jgi:hypothetical protein|nr:hypothetical protein [Caulobacteraceae bacterium]
MRTCSSCGDCYAYEVVAPGDLERTFDFEAEWQGLRLLCPACGALQRVSFAPVALSNQPAPGLPEGLRVHAVVGPGAEVVPFRPRVNTGSDRQR